MLTKITRSSSRLRQNLNLRVVTETDGSHRRGDNKVEDYGKLQEG